LKQRLEIAFVLIANTTRKCEPCVWKLCESRLASVLRRGNGEWELVSGIDADERANAQQRYAIAAIASGAAGGPMAALSGLVGQFLRRVHSQDI